ncbi:MAG: septal ring lytic transglycosylase RlpA family protein [Thermodesulfobacteriota bacterium]
MKRSGTALYALTAAAFMIAAALVFSGCSTSPPPKDTSAKTKSYRINGQWYHPIEDSDGFRESGLASWYGNPFHGRKTANGETYNMHAKTAAHKILPMDTFVLVKNKDNGKETVVRINDRGPFVRGRVIDLSYRAAREIDMTGPGTARVEVIAMEKDSAESREKDKDFSTGDFTVQVGAFAARSSAQNLKRTLEKSYDHVEVTTIKKDSQTLYRVRVGMFSSLESAEKTEKQLVKNGFENAFSVSREDS